MTSSKGKNGLTLWIGGSSSLARTYINQFGSEGLLLSGLEEKPPQWVGKAQYISINLAKLDRVKTQKLFQYYENIQTIIVGVRPLLFAAHVNTPLPLLMLEGIQTLLEQAVLTGNIQYVLHISSVAALDHLRAQKFVQEDDPIPPISEIQAPYDLFKRESEHVIETVCQSANIAYSHLRLSAIFSDDDECIQCSALTLQRRVGCYLPIPIDCNSSANVARAIQVMVTRAHQPDTKNETAYYYTRPLLLDRPVPYGYYLETFRQAYGVHSSSIWIPVWIVTWFVAFVHWVASWNIFFCLPYLDAADYLLQVSSREHSFDCSLFARDFKIEEETILECFIRRKTVLTNYQR
jgi:nucleoside-diphosphate-sugar epimerase